MEKFQNNITQLFNIDIPIIQGGMIWNSGWQLASAVSNAGGLGLLGAGSMYPEILKDQIKKCKKATSKPFGVNIPLLYPDIDAHIKTVIEEQIPIVFTSAGNPKTYTSLLKQNGIKVVHVVSSSKFAVKAEEAGCDAIVAEGFEAGGHNGREETTTLVLIPAVSEKVSIPVIAAGGIATGKQMFAAMVLGAAGIQMGSRFVASKEASGHDNFKKAVIAATEGDTALTLKKLTPVRLLNNEFYHQVKKLEDSGGSTEELENLLGRGRAKKGMFEGDMKEGELEIGQVSAIINDIPNAGDIVHMVWKEFLTVRKQPLK